MSLLTREVEEERGRVQRLRNDNSESSASVAAMAAQIKTLESERDLLHGRIAVLVSETESDARTASDDRRRSDDISREFNY